MSNKIIKPTKTITLDFANWDKQVKLDKKFPIRLQGETIRRYFKNFKVLRKYCKANEIPLKFESLTHNLLLEI